MLIILIDNQRHLPRAQSAWLWVVFLSHHEPLWIITATIVHLVITEYSYKAQTAQSPGDRLVFCRVLVLNVDYYGA